MNNFKRIICMLLALVCLFAFAACGEEKNSKDTDDASKDGVAYYVTYNNTKIKLGAAADDIIESLGEYQDRKEIGDCGGLGAQVKYSYPSVEVFVLESKTDGNIIDQITFRDDVVSTPEGVYIGMSIADAKDALGTPSSESDKSIEYENGKYLLKITVDGDSVKEIDYMTITE